MWDCALNSIITVLCCDWELRRCGQPNWSILHLIICVVRRLYYLNLLFLKNLIWIGCPNNRWVNNSSVHKISWFWFDKMLEVFWRCEDRRVWKGLIECIWLNLHLLFGSCNPLLKLNATWRHCDQWKSLNLIAVHYGVNDIVFAILASLGSDSFLDELNELLFVFG